MNWVGGWRNHTMKGSDTRKQREFFEKKRMQNRHNLLVSPSESHKKDNVGNMDLLTMFIVNQIALKKEHTVNPRFTHLPKSKRVQKSESRKPLELPMSPCSPSCLNLTESESHCSDQTLGLNKRKHLLDEFKFKTLSPLVESNLSDISASACQRQIDGSVSSFSSASPSLAEAFHLQPRPTINISPHPTTESYSTRNLQPVGLCENNPWAVSYQTEASEVSFAGGVQFGSTLHRESSGPSIHSAEIPLNHLKTNDQEEMQHFIGLNGDISEYRKKKRHLQKESPYPPTGSHEFSESYNTDHSINFYSQHMSGCVDCRPCKVHRTVSEHSCPSPRMFYQGEGFVTSEDVPNSVPSLRYILKEGKKQDGDSNMLHSKDILTSSHQATPSGISAPTRVMTFNQKVMRKHEHNERESKAHGVSKTLRWPIREQNCEEDQFVPSCLQTNTQSNKTHRKASPRTQDKAAQTAHFSSLISKDASVQCCLLKPARMSIFTKPTAHIHHSRTNKAPATRRQTRQSSENCGGNQFAHSEVHKMKWNTSWMTSQRKNTNQGPESIKAHESLGKSKSQSFVIKHPHCSHSNAPELKEQLSEKMVSRSERCEGHEEKNVNQNPTVNSSCTGEHNDAFTAETGEDRIRGKGKS